MDMDKEAAFLAKVVGARRGAGGARAGGRPEAVAARQWSRVSARARAALRSASKRSPERLEDLETAVCEFAEVSSSIPTAGGGDGPELVLPLGDAFARLLAHGVCEFHGLPSFSRVGPSGQKELVVRPPGSANARKIAAGAGRVDEGDGGDGERTSHDDGDEASEPALQEAEEEEEEEEEEEAVEAGPLGWRAPAMTCVAFMNHLGFLDIRAQKMGRRGCR